MAIQPVDAIIRCGVGNRYPLARSVGHKNPEQTARIVRDEKLLAAGVEHQPLWRAERATRRQRGKLVACDVVPINRTGQAVAGEYRVAGNDEVAEDLLRFILRQNGCSRDLTACDIA